MLTSTIEGLVVPVSAQGYRKERASLDGLFYWDKESQDIVLSHLGDFLPRIKDRDTSGIFWMQVNGREVCSESQPLGSAKLPAVIYEKLEQAVDRLHRVLEREDLTPEARLVIQQFKLPDPSRLPEFYRVYYVDKSPALLIIWGCNSSPNDFISPAEAIARLPREGFVDQLWRRALPFILALLALVLIALFVWLYYCWPRAEISISKNVVAPHEPVRATIKSVSGNQFSFDSPQGTLLNAFPAEMIVGSEVKSWERSAPLTDIDIAYGAPGRYEVSVIGTGEFFGIPLPSATVRKEVSVVNNDGAARSITSDQMIENRVLATGDNLRINLLTEHGELPARLSVTTVAPGKVSLAGVESQIAQPGVPTVLPPIEKPGVYRAKFLAANGNEEEHFVKIAPKGDVPLVANIRPSKATCGVHESVLLDASASMGLDPEAAIVAKEISLDGGKTFKPLLDDYFVTSFDSPGVKTIGLRIKDDKGRIGEDATSVDVVANQVPKMEELKSGRISERDLQRGAVYSIPEGILFQPGQTEISDQGKQLLSEFANSVAMENVIVSVVGHTDDVPISKSLRSTYADNQQLSAARASAAVEILAQGGVKRENLRSAGKGESAPVVPNTDEVSKARNRRIEISIIPKEQAAGVVRSLFQEQADKGKKHPSPSVERPSNR